MFRLFNALSLGTIDYGFDRSARAGNLRLARLFRALGADPNQSHRSLWYGALNYLPRHSVLEDAVLENDLATAKFLLQAGAKPFDSGFDSGLLKYTIGANKPEMFELLIKHGANVDADNGMPLFYAAQRGRSHMARRLAVDLAVPVRAWQRLSAVEGANKTELDRLRSSDDSEIPLLTALDYLGINSHEINADRSPPPPYAASAPRFI